MPSSLCYRNSSFKGLDLSHTLLLELSRNSHEDLYGDSHLDASTYHCRFHQHSAKRNYRCTNFSSRILPVANVDQTTLITSTVTTATVATVTATTYSIDGSNKKRGLTAAKHIPNPVDPDELDKRTLPKSTAKIPPCLTAFASGIISSACACLSIPTPTQVRISRGIPSMRSISNTMDTDSPPFLDSHRIHSLTKIHRHPHSHNNRPRDHHHNQTGRRNSHRNGNQHRRSRR